MKYLKTLFLLLVPFFITSCTSTGPYSNQKEVGHKELYSYPKPLSGSLANPSRYKRVAFVALNNLEGNISPKSYIIPNKMNEKRILKIGGISGAKAYIDVLKYHYNKDLVVLDSGSFTSKDVELEHMIFLYNYLGIDYTTLGKEEFSLDPSYYPEKIQSYLEKAKFKIINSNFFDLTTAENFKWENVSSTSIQKINGVNIGIIGLYSPKNSKKVPAENFRGIFVQNMARTVLEKSKSLRHRGAKIIVLLYSNGINCTEQLSETLNIHYKKVNFNPESNDICSTYKNELAVLLNQLPPGKIDLVISSGKKSKVVNYINRTPVLQNFGKGDYLSWAEFYYDTKLGGIAYEKSRLFQPIKLCHNFLRNHNDCFTHERLNDQETAPAMFLGKQIMTSPLPSYK